MFKHRIHQFYYIAFMLCVMALYHHATLFQFLNLVNEMMKHGSSFSTSCIGIVYPTQSSGDFNCMLSQQDKVLCMELLNSEHKLAPCKAQWVIFSQASNMVGSTIQLNCPSSNHTPLQKDLQ
jgi:hypothetical protein